MPPPKNPATPLPTNDPKAPLCKGGSADRRWGIVTLPIHRLALVRLQSLRHGSRRATRLRVGPLCRCATSPHTVGSHPLHKGCFVLAQPYCLIAQIKFTRRGRRCGVAQRSMPHWGIEPHERASSAGWRRSLCAAKRRRPVQFPPRRQIPGRIWNPPLRTTKKPQQIIEISHLLIVECWPRAGASPSALGFLRARLRSVRAKREPKRP